MHQLAVGNYHFNNQSILSDFPTQEEIGNFFKAADLLYVLWTNYRAQCCQSNAYA
jgi:hypothetical protein